MVYKWRNDSNFLNCLEAERRRWLATSPHQLLVARQYLTSHQDIFLYVEEPVHQHAFFLAVYFESTDGDGTRSPTANSESLLALQL